MKNLIHYGRNASMFSIHRKSLYQSTKGWLCPDRSCCNNVLISVEMVLTPEMIFLCFIPSRLWLENLEFELFGLFSRSSDLNTNSCGSGDFDQSCYICSTQNLSSRPIRRHHQYTTIRYFLNSTDTVTLCQGDISLSS